MDWEKLPVDQILLEITNQSNAVLAFENIIGFGKEAISSKIWDTFSKMDVKNDIEESTKWIKRSLNKFPDSKGIYLGLDTLNMNGGKGSNVEIGLSSTCDPEIISDDWIFKCDNYGSKHLIKGLYLVSDSFTNIELSSSGESSFAEYVVFLGYSGLVLRDALLNVETENDFISIWGFHDGDMFYLVQKINNKVSVIANKSL
jgi:hypothetical protein